MMEFLTLPIRKTSTYTTLPIARVPSICSWPTVRPAKNHARVVTKVAWN